MRKLFILILVSFTLLQWSSFANATSVNDAYIPKPLEDGVSELS